MANWNSFRDDLGLFSADERAVFLDFLAAAGGNADLADFMGSLAQAKRRTCQRSASDAETDLGRRILVGARLPRPQAEKHRECAASHGLSLYRFVANALEREYWRLREHDVGGIM